MTARAKDPVIDIARMEESWPDLEDAIHLAAQKTLRRAGYAAGGTEISIVLAGDDFIQNLNKTYRGKDKPTNVLSFPQDEPGMLGDVILAYETLEKESRDQGKSFKDHALHMIVHGILHLLGHDHENDDDAQEMESLEIAILGDLGVKNPYETEKSMQ